MWVYRQPADRQDPGTETLVTGGPSYLVLSSQDCSELAKMGSDSPVAGVVRALASRFGTVLLLELCTTPALRAADRAREVRDEREPLHAPVFRLYAPPELRSFAAALELELSTFTCLDPPPRLMVLESPRPGTPLLAEERTNRCVRASLELDPVFYDIERGKTFPLLLRRLRYELTRALERALVPFCRDNSSLAVASPAGLGRRVLLDQDVAIDEQVSTVGRAFDFLLNITPINTHEAWEQFRAVGCEREPKFRYRPIDVNPGLLRRRLYNIAFDCVEDPIVAELLREQREELAQKLRMLEYRGERSFFYGSLQLYGGVDEELQRVALGLPAGIIAESGPTAGVPLNAEEFRTLAERELAFYRDRHPDFTARVEIRHDVVGLLVAHGNLLVDSRNVIPRERAEALLQHEVGTHLVTHYNGLKQPLHQLCSGLAGYEELQEGLALLAEHLVGGLTAARLRLLAGRVIAVRHLVDGASFIEVFRQLHREHGFSRFSAFVVTMRVFRSGGLTKDAIYLRGLVALLQYLERGEPFERLFVGKIGLSHVPVVGELLERGVLHPPAVLPRYLARSRAAKRLERLRHGVGLLDLVERKVS
jgi:uncharacterized protein (TIGR02421 family)